METVHTTPTNAELYVDGLTACHETRRVFDTSQNTLTAGGSRAWSVTWVVARDHTRGTYIKRDLR